MKRHDQEQMLVLYDQWQASGESKKDFAVRNNVRPSTFYYWSRKFEVAESDPVSGFQSVSIEDTSFTQREELLAAIDYPSGARLELYSPAQRMTGTGVELLKKLIE